MIELLTPNAKDVAERVTRTRRPVVVLEKGAQPLVFNRDEDFVACGLAALNDKEAKKWEPYVRRWGPVLRNNKAHLIMMDGYGMQHNAQLDKREWAQLDRVIFEMVKLRRNAMADLESYGLVTRTTLAEWVSQWRVASERVRPNVAMEPRTRADRDRTDRLTYAVPLPVYRTDYEIGSRELESSRVLGAALDTFEAGESAAAIAEEEERTLFSGNTSVVVQGTSISGYTTLTARDTGTAAAYGGGDFGTISQIKPTFLGMLAALAAKRYHGPFMCYIAQTQFHQMLETYTDGSGDTALERVLELPQIDDIKASDFLSAGNLVMVQMTPNVVDWRRAMDVENREWMSGDGTSTNYAVMSAGAPRLKTDSAGNAGIAHATSC